MDAVASVSSCRSTATITAWPSSAEVVIRAAGEFGPCSACPSRSAATSSASAVWSASTATSEGPASRSIATVPNSCLFASAT